MPYNEGRCPREAEIRGEDGSIAGFRKVHVVLRNGFSTRKAGHDPWPAGGARPPTRWTLKGGSHDILEWEIV